MGRNNKVEPLSDKTQRKLGILQNYYRVDMQKRVVVVPLHYDKASDIICEDLTDAKRPLIRNDVLERISDIEATIPDEFSIYISLKVDDCEGYDYGYLMSGL